MVKGFQVNTGLRMLRTWTKDERLNVLGGLTGVLKEQSIAGVGVG